MAESSLRIHPSSLLLSISTRTFLDSDQIGMLGLVLRLDGEIPVLNQPDAPMIMDTIFIPVFYSMAMVGSDLVTIHLLHYSRFYSILFCILYLPAVSVVSVAALLPGLDLPS